MALAAYATSSGQSAYPNRLDFFGYLLIGIAGSGQSAYPNRLDFTPPYVPVTYSSGQSAYPNRLDSRCDNPLIRQGVFRISG